MSTTTYTPNAGSLAEQVCGYLRNNPSAFLTLDDITDRFSGARGNIHTLLAKCLEANLLKRSRNNDDEYVYSIGLLLDKVGIDIDTVHRTRKTAKVATSKTHAPDDQAEFALTITNDPLPAWRSSPVLKYHTTFDQLSLGQGLRMPTAHVGKVASSLRKYIEVKGLKARAKIALRYKGTDGIPDAGFGRVWLLDGVSKFPSKKAGKAKP